MLLRRHLPAFLSRLFRPTHPVLAATYRAFEDFSQAGELESYEYVVLDTELTGLNRRRDEIIAIGGVRIKGLKIHLGETFYSLVRPHDLSPNLSTFIHRLTPEELAAAPPLAEVLPAFAEFCGRSLLVGHCLGLDMHFLNRAARIILGGSFPNPGIDTMRLARGYKRSRQAVSYSNVDTSGSYALTDLAKEFGLVTFQAHDALEDALQTAYLFLFLVKHFRAKGVRTLKDLYQAGRLWPLH